MSYEINDLIAEARDGNMEDRAWMIDVIDRLADALESPSTSPGDDERETLRWVCHTSGLNEEGELDGNLLADSIWAAGFRRLSPLTQEALSETIYSILQIGPVVDRIVEAILSRFSLPVPAEVEWGTRWSGYTDNRGFMPAHSRESAEAVLEEFEGHEVVYRTPAGPWVPVKGTEQRDDEKCTHEEFYLGRCVACGTTDDREYDPDDMPTIRAASEMAGCQNRGWYHDGSEEAEAHAQGRAVRPCPHHDGSDR